MIGQTHLLRLCLSSARRAKVRRRQWGGQELSLSADLKADSRTDRLTKTFVHKLNA